jgi:glycosyltransferase involved in cell wall biosynthesis
LEDQTGQRLAVTPQRLALLASRFALDAARAPFFLLRLDHQVRGLLARPIANRRRLVPDGRPAYLRTDLLFAPLAGGSIAHTAGVLNHLKEFFGEPIFISTAFIPTATGATDFVLVPPGRRFWDLRELPSLHFTSVFARQAAEWLDRAPPAFIYQRYCLNNYSGALLARRYNVPLVLEYNGSEVWTSRHWGSPLRHERLSRRIELLNLHEADVVVVVSEAARQNLLELEIEPGKILVNPNGVDPQTYRPELDPLPVRRRLGLEGKTVIGFIGTFGRWHGTELLALAFAKLLSQRPDYRGRVHLLMIGDGVNQPECREILARQGSTGSATFTGMVPQAEGPSYLAACDILVSPQVPNPDGTPFFGSPTKLFEYMAMGRGIVAAGVGQLAEVLTHGQTAWLFNAGDVDACAAGIARLIDDPLLRRRLGQAARTQVVERHTWLQHTRRIAEKVEECCQP